MKNLKPAKEKTQINCLLHKLREELEVAPGVMTETDERLFRRIEMTIDYWQARAVDHKVRRRKKRQEMRKRNKAAKHAPTGATRDMKMLRGYPPYDDYSNICYGDGYFVKSLEQRYGMPIRELEQATGITEYNPDFNDKW